MLHLLLTLQAASVSGQEATKSTQTQSQTETESVKAVEKYRGGFFVYVIKDNVKTEYELPKDKKLDKDAFKKEVSSLKGVKEVKYDEKTKSFTIIVEDETELAKTISKHGFVKVEKKQESK